MTHLHQRRTISPTLAPSNASRKSIEFAEEGSSDELSALDLTRCVLRVNQENDKSVDPDFLDVGLDFVVQELCDYSDPFETLASSVDEMWRRGWAPGTKHRVVHDLGDGPADVFTEATGVDLDDFLALAWVFWNAAKNEGQVA